MSITLSQLFRKKKGETRQIWNREFRIVEQGLDEKQVVAFINDLINSNGNSKKVSADSLRLLIERAITDAEQIATSITTKAKTEAEEEAVKIVEQAKREADEIIQRARTERDTEEAKQARAAQKQAEQEAKLAAKEEAKRTAEEAKQARAAQKQAEQEARLAAKEEAKRTAEEAKQARAAQKQTEQAAKLAAKEEATEEPGEAEQTAITLEQGEQEAGLTEIEETSEIEKELDTAETVEPIKEEVQELPSADKKNRRKEEPVYTPLELDKDSLYTGEIELAISVPVNPAAVSKLYNYLQSTPDMKILYTRGSWDRGTSITVSLDKPLPLIGMISNISGIKIMPISPDDDNVRTSAASSILGANRKQATRIDLLLKEG